MTNGVFVFSLSHFSIRADPAGDPPSRCGSRPGGGGGDPSRGALRAPPQVTLRASTGPIPGQAALGGGLWPVSWRSNPSHKPSDEKGRREGNEHSCGFPIRVDSLGLRIPQSRGVVAPDLPKLPSLKVTQESVLIEPGP